MQLYLHDFSEIDGSTISDDGLYDYSYLGEYWGVPDRAPFFIQAGGELAGFVLVNSWSVRGATGIRSIAEFFVLRKYRRSGIGRTAALEVFKRFPGSWEVAVMKANAGGTAFWRNVINAATGGRFREEAVDNDLWEGPVWSFSSAPIVEESR
jgi:predicted acetyltransferase